jgi:hypothetical protein
MTKHMMAVLVATCLWAPQAAGKSSNVQDTDRQGTKLGNYLPDTGSAAPRPNPETRTKLPKNDLPLCRYAVGIGPKVLQPKGFKVHISLNELSERRVP